MPQGHGGPDVVPHHEGRPEQQGRSASKQSRRRDTKTAGARCRTRPGRRGACSEGAGINEGRNSGAVGKRLDRGRPGRMVRKGREVYPPLALGGAARDTSSAPAESFLRGRGSAPNVLGCPGATSAAAGGHISVSTSGACETAESSSKNPQRMQTGIVALGGSENLPFVSVCLPPRSGVASFLEPGSDGAMIPVCP